ncbi:MAG TPA: anti-sigma factor [Gaiellaceae bacterium]|nr:anti-sigma factor [Gaiellaceae bacterium]
MNREELRELLAGAALGAASPAEAEAVERAAETDPALAQELAELRGTVGMLDASLVRATPSAELRDRVAAAVATPERARPAVAARGRPRRRPALPRLVPAVAGLAAAAAAVLIAVVALDDGADPAAEIRLAAASGPDGEAALYDPGDAGGRLVVRLSSVPAPPSGHHYEVWVLRRGADRMEAVGSFTPTGGKVRLELPLPGPGDYAAVDVSLEEDGGSPEHSGTSVVTGAFPAGA